MEISAFIYANNGKLVRRVTCAAEHLDAQLFQDEGFVACVPGVSLDSHYVEKGQLIKIPFPPTSRHTFDYTKKEWVGDYEATAEVVRKARDALLLVCDWTQLEDVPIAVKERWVPYRQALRDISDQSGFPTEVIWPIIDNA